LCNQNFFILLYLIIYGNVKTGGGEHPKIFIPMFDTHDN